MDDLLKFSINSCVPGWRTIISRPLRYVKTFPTKEIPVSVLLAIGLTGSGPETIHPQSLRRRLLRKGNVY